MSPPTDRRGSVPFRRVLCAVAFSPRAPAVVAAAHRLSCRFGAELALVHAGRDPVRSRERLLALLDAAGVAADGVALHSARGRPDEVVCRLAATLPADLVVLGANEREPLLREVLGSVARRVARAAPCSVLLLTSPEDARRPFGTVVVTTAFDARSRRMLETAIALARHDGPGTLHVVREYDVHGARATLASAEQSATLHLQERRWRTDEECGLADFLDGFEISDLRVERACLDGFEGAAAVEYAEAEGADLLVVPAPARPLSVWDRFFKHPAELVLQALPCALLLYREGAATRTEASAR